MRTFEHDAEIEVAAEAAWAVVADYRRDPQWRTGVLSMVPAHPELARVGLVADEVIRVAGKRWHNIGMVTEAVDGEWFAWRTTEGAVADGSRSVVPVGPTRCRVRLTLNVTPTGFSALAAPLLARILDRNLRRDLERLRELLEQEAADLPRTGAVV
jgi:uncharacterized membrane protein